jgi:hypothetical protein
VCPLQAVAGKRKGSQSKKGQISPFGSPSQIPDRPISPPFLQAHLQSCSEYASWRSAGNGQELAPPNPYNGAGRRGVGDSYGSDDLSLTLGHTSLTPTMQRPRSTVDMSKYFDEFFDDSLDRKVEFYFPLASVFKLYLMEFGSARESDVRAAALSGPRTPHVRQLT